MHIYALTEVQNLRIHTCNTRMCVFISYLSQQYALISYYRQLEDVYICLAFVFFLKLKIFFFLNYNKSFHTFDLNFVFIFRAVAHKTNYGTSMGKAQRSAKHIDFVVFFKRFVVCIAICSLCVHTHAIHSSTSI